MGIREESDIEELAAEVRRLRDLLEELGAQVRTLQLQAAARAE